MIPKEKPVQAEDILFTMFEEQDDFAFESKFTSEPFLNESDVEVDDYKPLDYFEAIAAQTSQANASPKEKKQPEEEVKEEVKEPPKKQEGAPIVPPKEEKPKEKEIEPNADMLLQLTTMGFPLELSKKGLIKVKNQSAEAAIDAIMTLQEEELKKNPKGAKPKSTIKIMSYECAICTYKNPDGAAVCEICGAGAPQTAMTIVKSEEEIKREKEEEEARLKKEVEEIERKEKERIAKEEEERKRIEEERLQKEKAEAEARMREELKIKTSEYFADA